MRLLRIMIAAAVLSAPGGVVAQTPAGLGVVRGRVIDSLVTGRPLAGATVELVELAKQTTTDPRGIFRFDSIPVGTYLLTFHHPDLAAFGFTPPEQTIRVDPGMMPPVLLATPAPATVYHRLCPAPRDQDTGVLLGTIRNAGTDRPLVATVRGEWVVNFVSPDGATTRQPRAVRTTADSAGRFQLCGVPSDVAVAVWTTAANGDGGPIELRLEGREVGVRHLTHSLADPLTAQQAKVHGTVSGGGQPVALAHVRLLGHEGRAVSDATGRFVLDSLPAGSHTLEVGALGFAPSRRQIDLPPGGELRLDLTLAAVARELPELNVTVSEATLARSGFEERRRRGMGGHYITREEIARRGSIRVEELLRTAPGIRLEPVGSSEYRIVSLRGGPGWSDSCQPTVFVDSFKVPVDPDSGISLPVSPNEVEGIEVHNSTTSAPLQYRIASASCGVILIWTSRGRS